MSTNISKYYIIHGEIKMNKIIIDRNTIDKTLQSMHNVVYKKSRDELAANIFIESIEDKLVLKSTDYEMSMRISIPIKDNQGEIKSALESNSFFNIVKALEDDEVILELKDNYLHFTQGRTKLKTPTIEYGNERLFATLDYKKMEKIEINPTFFLNGAKKIVHACNDRDIANPALQGVQLEIKKNNISLVATDTKRLAYIKQDFEQNIKDTSIIIPRKTINQVLKFFTQDFDFYLQRGEYNNEEFIEQVAFVSGDTELYVKPINAKFPEYEFLLQPRVNEHILNFNKTELLKAINRMNVTNNNSKITFSKDNINLNTLDLDVEKIDANIEISCSLELDKDLIVGINNRHLIECLSASNNEDVNMFIVNSDTHITIDIGDVREVIMPYII